MASFSNKDNFQIEIRTIFDYNGNIYDIYDLMKKDVFGRWHSICTYDDLATAKKQNKDITIVNNSKIKGDYK